MPGLPGPEGVVWALDSRPQRGLLGASAREPDPSWAHLQPLWRKGNSGWQEEPRQDPQRLDPQRLGVVSKKGRRWQMGRRSAGGRGAPGGGHVEKWVLLVALLTTPLTISELRKRCHSLKCGGDSERPSQQCGCFEWESGLVPENCRQESGLRPHDTASLVTRVG